MQSKIRATYQDRQGFNRLLSLVAAAIVAIMLTAQLYTFEEMPSALQNVLSYTSDSSAATLAAVIAALQLAALAYLLPLALSQLARGLTRVALVAINIVWVSALAYALATGVSIGLVPVVGTIFDITPGLFVVSIVGLLVASSFAALYCDRHMSHS